MIKYSLILAMFVLLSARLCAVSVTDILIQPQADDLVQTSEYPDTNPVILGAADPDIIMDDNKVYVYSTGGTKGTFSVYSSSDLVTWEKSGPIFNFADVPWIPADRGAWAPGMIKRDDIYYLYYSVGPKPSYIGVAWSTSPDGTFTDSGNYLIADFGVMGFEAIDAKPFRDPVSGKYYLYAGGSAGANLKVWELNDDMVSLAGEIAVDRPSYFTEGAYMHYRNGIYYMSYSNGGWQIDGNYCVYYSTSSSPLGPWTFRGRILQGNDIYKSPGHHSILYNGATDEWMIVYHRWDPVNYNNRSVAIERLYYYPNGLIKPIVMTTRGVGPIALSPYLPGDLNKDYFIDLTDLRTFCNSWLSTDYSADIYPAESGDGFVDMLDYDVFSLQWGRSTLY